MEKVELLQSLAAKMLETEVNHLSLIDSLTLVKNDINIKTELSYVCDTEELNNDDNCWGYEFDINGNWQEEIDRINSIKRIEVGDNYNHFNEFTHEICPAPTYMELLKEIKSLSN